MDKSREELLVARAQKGDSKAFDELLEMLGARLWRMAKSFTRNELDADYVLQNARIKAWNKIGQFRGKSGFLTWFATVLRSAYYSYLRDTARRSEREILDPWAAQYAQDPGRADGADERTEMLKAALDALPVRQRKAIELHYFEGLPIREVASRLGIRYDHCKVEISKGRRRLKKLLGS